MEEGGGSVGAMRAGGSRLEVSQVDARADIFARNGFSLKSEPCTSSFGQGSGRPTFVLTASTLLIDVRWRVTGGMPCIPDCQCDTCFNFCKQGLV